MTQQSERTASSLQDPLCSYRELFQDSLALCSGNLPKVVLSVGVLLLVASDLILIVVSLPPPLSFPPPPCFLSQALFSQTSSESTHHTDLEISCKLMFYRCSSCLTRWLPCSLPLTTDKKQLVLPFFWAAFLDFYLLDILKASSHLAVMFSYMYLSTYRERDTSFLLQKAKFLCSFLPVVRICWIEIIFFLLNVLCRIHQLCLGS